MGSRVPFARKELGRGEGPPPPQAASIMACRLMFLALAVAPMVGLVGWTAHRSLFRGQAYVAIQFRDQLGLDMSTSHLRRPNPRKIQLEDVRWSDPENRSYLAACTSVEWEQRQGEQCVRLVDLSLQRNHVASCWRVLEERLLRQSYLVSPPWQIAAANVQLADAEGTITLRDLVVRVARHPDGPGTALQLQFRPDGEQKTVSISMERRSDLPYPRSIAHVDARHAPVPSLVMNPGVGVEAILGRRSRFQGQAWYDGDAHGSVCELVGEFSQVDLSRLVPLVLGGSAEGWASVRVVQAKWDGRRLEALDLIVDAHQGSLAGECLAACEARLGLTVTDSVRNQPGWQETVHAFDRLAMRLRLGTDRFRITSVPGDETTPLISDGDSALLLPGRGPTTAIARETCRAVEQFLSGSGRMRIR